MVNELITEHTKDFEQSVAHFADEAAKLRTGRANPSLVENLMADYYGTKTPLLQIASITIPEARQILISPWDKGSLGAIETAVRESDLGLNPVNDGSVIRLTLPALNEERRRELVKALNQRAEEARIAIRTIREDIWKKIQDLERSGTIGEDDKFHGKDELQKVVDGFNLKIEEAREKKEAEIMTV